MVFSVSYDVDLFTDKIYKNALVQLNNFFGFEWRDKKPKIYVVPDRKTIDMMIGEKTKSWVVGWADKGDIFVLDRKNYEKESSEPYKDIYYKGLIVHELVHAYFNVVAKECYEPAWVSEGVARYLAGENKYRDGPIKFLKFLEFFKSSMDNEVYHESGHAVQLLIEKYGKVKFLRMIKQFPKVRSKIDFNKLFRRVYGFDASYKEFNKMLDS